MIEDIIVLVMILITIVSGIFGIFLEHRGNIKDSAKDVTDYKDNKEERM